MTGEGVARAIGAGAALIAMGSTALSSLGCASAALKSATPPSTAPPATSAAPTASHGTLSIPDAASADSEDPEEEVSARAEAPSAAIPPPAATAPTPRTLATASDVPCAEVQPAAQICACLRKHVESWGEGVRATCDTDRKIGEARIVRITTADRHAGVQYFIVHDGPKGSAVLALLEHHVPGGGGVYRDFSIKDARVQAIGAGRVLRVDTTVVETEITFAPSSAVGKKRELSRDETTTLCALAAPALRAPFCLERLPAREQGLDAASGETWDRVYDLKLAADGGVAHLPVRGTGTDAPGRFKLW